jgi:hypothetical protein
MSKWTNEKNIEIFKDARGDEINNEAGNEQITINM